MSYDINIKYTPEFLRDMTLGLLDIMLFNAQRRFFELRCQTSPHGRVKFAPRPHLFGKVKKDIARIKTIITEKTNFIK